MKQLLVLIATALVAVNSLQAVIPPEKNDFLGEWKFESPHAPDGYQQGIFVIQEKDGLLAGEIQFGDAYSVEMKDMAIADGVLNFGIGLEYEEVTVKATIENNTMKGSAKSPEGLIPFEAKRVKNEDR